MPKYVHDIQKKQHRERAQPTERKRLGFLEKKKDYKLRAKDYHDKQNRLKTLREKGFHRNPDEYYHGMTLRKTDKQGVLIKDRETSVSLSVDQVKLLKTQDENYVKTKRMNEEKQIERLSEGIMFGSRANHTVFVEDQGEFDNFDVAKHFNTDKRLVDRVENRVRLEQLTEEVPVVARSEEQRKKIEDWKIKNMKKLQQKILRSKELAGVEQELAGQREGMKNGDKKKIGKNSFKWKSQRKK